MPRRQWTTAIVGALIAALLVAACGGGSDSDTTTTSRKPATTTTTKAVALDLSTAVFPVGDVRYSSPVEAATAFANEYVGFTSPIVGQFVAGDSRSGEVPVQATNPGVVTTVLVRQLDSAGHWWVLGSSTPNLVLTSPSAGAAITSAVTLKGQSTAFEATFNVEIRQDRTAPPLGGGPAMGGSNGDMGPFTDVVSFTQPTQPRGAIVLKTYSMKDGAVAEASVIRIAFAGV
ncbi:MAG: Gmad2 immunoglobulin-like domain-containing protein [Actinomycetes bacterium]